jgi:septum formation protein
MGFVFTIANSPEIDETALIDPDRLAASLKKLAAAKARPVARKHPGSLVLGADTVVVKDAKVMGKPRDRREAFSMLKKLSGAKHSVMTAVAVECAGLSFSVSALARTDVFFRSLAVDEIEAYLDCGEYRDKAGAYAIQGRAMVFIDGIRGCYYNVVGLPVPETIDLFRKFALFQRKRQ